MPPQSQATCLNRFFVSDSIPALLKPPRSARPPLLSQSLLRQRLHSGFQVPGAERQHSDVSIASSSATPFRLLGEPGVGKSSIVSRLNRFFVSDSIPATRFLGFARSITEIESQSLLRQRLDSGRGTDWCGCYESRHGCLNRFFVSDSIPANPSDSAVKANPLSQSLLRQRLHSGKTSRSRVVSADFCLNRFFVSDSIPATRHLAARAGYSSLASQSLLRQRLHSGRAVPSRNESEVRTVSIASSSATPFRRYKSSFSRSVILFVSIASSSATPFRREGFRWLRQSECGLNRFFVSDSIPASG